MIPRSLLRGIVLTAAMLALLLAEQIPSNAQPSVPSPYVDTSGPDRD